MSFQYKSGNFASVTVGDPNRDRDAYTKNAVVCQLAPGAKVPERANETDAGADLFPLMPEGDILVIQPGQQRLVDTGVAVKIPANYAGFLHARSSQRVKGITCWGTGIIDSDYRGTLKVVISNQSTVDYVIDASTKIAQLVIQRVELVEFIDGWNDTNRGVNGFGSTGK